MTLSSNIIWTNKNQMKGFAMWNKQWMKKRGRNQVRVLLAAILCFVILSGFVSCGEKGKGTLVGGSGGSETVQSPIDEEPKFTPVEPQTDVVPEKRITEFYYFSDDWQIPNGNYSNYYIETDENGDLFAGGFVYDADISYDVKYYVPLLTEKYFELEGLVEKYHLADLKVLKDSDGDETGDTATFFLYINWSDDTAVSNVGFGDDYIENYEEVDEAIRAFFRPLGEGTKAEGALYKTYIEISGDPNILSFVVPNGYSVGSVEFADKSNGIIRIMDEDGNIVCHVYVLKNRSLDFWKGDEKPYKGSFGIEEINAWEDVSVRGIHYQKCVVPNLTVYRGDGVMDVVVFIECSPEHEAIAEKIAGTLRY